MSTCIEVALGQSADPDQILYRLARARIECPLDREPVFSVYGQELSDPFRTGRRRQLLQLAHGLIGLARSTLVVQECTWFLASLVWRPLAGPVLQRLLPVDDGGGERGALRYPQRAR